MALARARFERNATSACLVLRHLWVGIHRVTLAVPKPLHGSKAHAEITWLPKAPGYLNPEDLREFRRACQQAIDVARTRWDLQLVITTEFFSTGAPNE